MDVYLTDCSSVSIADVPYKTPDYNCSILGPNGKFYFIPCCQTSIMIDNQYTNVTDTTTLILPSGSGIDSKWKSGVLAPNGKIYCPPSKATTFLILDPIENTMDTTSIIIPDLNGTNIKWTTSCITPDGIIYSIPTNETRILIVNTFTNIYDLTSISINNDGKYSSCCYAPSVNKIYAPPGDTTLTNVLSIDTTTNICDTTSISLSGKYESIVLGCNDKLYCAPFTLPLISSSLGIIDPADNTTDSTSLLLPNGSLSANYSYPHRGLMSSPDNFIYYMPGSQTIVIVINPLNNKVDSTSLLGINFYQTNIFNGNQKLTVKRR